MNISKKKYLLIFGDIACLYFGLWLTLAIRYFDFGSDSWLNHFWPFTIIFLTWLIIFYIDDLYDLNYGRQQISLISRLIRDNIIIGIIAISFFYFSVDRLFSIRPQRVLLINLAIATVLIYLWRVIFHQLLKNRQIAENVLIIGYNQEVDEIIKEIKNKPAFGYKIKSLIYLNQNQKPNLEGIDLYDNYDDLADFCKKNKIKNIITAIDEKENQKVTTDLFACLPLQINFYNLSIFYEKITGKIPVNAIGQNWFLENLASTKSRLYHNFKRLIDIFVSIGILIAFIPFLPLVVLGVKLGSPGPIFFKQNRVGKNNRQFTIVKFRSMFTNAENNGAVWASKNDPRVTKFGKFIRKTRIDEIPQLLNIIRGEMSLIGPRPERPEFVEELSAKIPFYKERLLVKPGLTGWAQVAGPAYGGSKEESLEKLQYDLFYIKNQSLGLDLSIVLKTVKTILSRKGQ